LVAPLVFLAVSGCITWYGRGQRSAWVRIAFPGDTMTDSCPLLGLSFLQGSDPLFIENAPSIQQVAFFSGWRDASVDNYIHRPLPAVFASLLAPAAGTMGAWLLANWSAWAVCAWATWRLSKKLFNDDLSALLAVAFVGGGMGPVVHISDYSAHLWGFAGYYLGIYLLYASGIPFGRRPWRAHLTVGAFIAVVWLAYGWWAVMLVALYALSAIRHNRWYQVAGATALALTPGPLWGMALRLFGLQLPGYELWMVKLTAGEWVQRIQHPRGTAVELARRLGEFAAFDSAVVVVLGILGCLLLPRDRAVRRFGVMVLAVPVLAGIVTIPMTNRGYVVYGISIWVYCWLGRMLATGLRGRPWLRPVTGVTLLVALATHLSWSTAHIGGSLGPLKSYMCGLNNMWVYFVHPQPTILSLTGQEPTPVLWGGDASLGDAGAYVADPRVVIDRGIVSWQRALATRALPLGYVALFGVVAARSVRRRLLVAAVTGSLAVVSSGWSGLTFRTVPDYVDTIWTPCDTPFPGPLSGRAHTDFLPRLPPRATLAYRVDLSPAFRDALRDEWEPQDQLRFFLHLDQRRHDVWDPTKDLSAIEITVAADPRPIPVEKMEGYAGSCRARDPQAALGALCEAGHLTLEVTNQSARTETLAGWQRRGLPGRRLTIIRAGGAEAEPPNGLPMFEIRLVRPDGSIKLAGY
jgi:hypothetical protein